MAFLASSAPRPPRPDLHARGQTLPLSARFAIMGVVNVTPDSFSDGGQHFAQDAAVAHGLQLVADGADILDVGGESTRPGAHPVSVDEELRRVIGVVEALADQTDAWISVDTTKSAVAQRALDAGAHLINDISGLGFDPHMAEVVADAHAALVIMHIRGTPLDMQSRTDYRDLIDSIRAYFEARIDVANRAGVASERIILDPGIGFGKTVAQNYEIIRHLARFTDLGCPIMLGTSRKSLIGAVLDKPADQRVWGTAATVATGLWAGADIVRVHDVAQMHDVVRVTEAICATATASSP